MNALYLFVRKKGPKLKFLKIKSRSEGQLDICLGNTVALLPPPPPVATKSKYGKIFKSFILTPSDPQEHVMSVKCEEQSKFGYFVTTQTLNIALC